MSYVLETTLGIQVLDLANLPTGVMKDMLRRFPAQAADVVPRLAGALDVVQETNAIVRISLFSTAFLRAEMNLVPILFILLVLL